MHFLVGDEDQRVRVVEWLMEQEPLYRRTGKVLEVRPIPELFSDCYWCSDKHSSDGPHGRMSYALAIRVLN